MYKPVLSSISSISLVQHITTVLVARFQYTNIGLPSVWSQEIVLKTHLITLSYRVAEIQYNE